MNNLYLLIWLVVLFSFAWWFKKKLPQWIGRGGEKFVSRKLRELDPEHYKILNDLLLPSQGNTSTTQIDHVVVSSYGIFVIETKAHKGWIFGNAHDDQWTQVIYRSKTRFYNPLRQNYAHIKSLEALLRPQYPNVPIYPFIIFPSAGKLKITGTDIVGNGRDTIAKIKTYTNQVISDTDRDAIYKLLSEANIIDKEVRKTHIQDTRNIKR